MSIASLEKPSVAASVPHGALKLADAAAYLSLNEKTVRRLVARGELKPVRSVRHLLFSVHRLDDFLAQ